MSISPSVLEQRPLRISQPKPIHYRAPIEHSHQPREVKKIPRPRNAFIIFRCQTISKLHSKDNVGLDRPPTPEKTLSKRAGVAWRQLSQEEKQVYKDLAEKERLEHQEKYPGYRYQPNRGKVNRPRLSGPPTRREQVESLLLRGTSYSGTSSESSESVCPSPASESPELAIPALAEDSAPRLSHRRSMSLPHLQGIHVHEPYPFSRTYFIEPTSCVSSPGPGPHRTSRRSRSARDRSYSPVSMTPPPDCAFDLQYPHATVPFSSLAPHASSLSLPDLVALSEGMALDDASSSGYLTPQTSSSVQEHSSEYLPLPPGPPPGALFHRRQRSNTAPSAVISPLAAVSTSLGGWNGAITATAAATAGLPSFSVSSTEEHFAAASSSAHVSSPLTDGTVPYGEFFSNTGQESFGTASSLCVPDADLDTDRTPRRADFPIGVQGQYTQHHHTPVDEYPSMHSSYELQSYAAGLQDLEITASSPYGPSCGAGPGSSYEELDFNEYLTMNNY